MNEEKGFFCANELEIGLALTSAMIAVFTAKLTPSIRSRVALGAEKFGGKKAFMAGIVDAAMPLKDVEPTAMEMAKAEAPKGANKEIYKTVKQRLYKDAIA